MKPQKKSKIRRKKDKRTREQGSKMRGFIVSGLRKERCLIWEMYQMHWKRDHGKMAQTNSDSGGSDLISTPNTRQCPIFWIHLMIRRIGFLVSDSCDLQKPERWRERLEDQIFLAFFHQLGKSVKEERRAGGGRSRREEIGSRHRERGRDER